VLIAQSEGEDGVRTWVENRPASNLAKWKEASLWLARGARDQRDFRADVYLCLKTDYLVSDFEYEFCRALAEAARRYCWGAKLYVAVDQTVDLTREQRDLPHLVAWFDQMQEGRQRPTDILLVNVDRMARLDPDDVMELRRMHDELRQARDESARRYEAVPGLLVPDQWHCWTASREYRTWLEDVSANDARNLIIVLRDGRYVKAAVDQARAKIRDQAGGRCVIGRLGTGKLSAGVIKLAQEYNVPVISFRGLLELRYFLMRLNRLCQQPGRTEALSRTVEAVSVTRPVFHVGSDRRPRLLITSAFHPAEHEANSLDAVTDVGLVSRAAPAEAECHVHPYFRAADLPALLKRMPELTAWLHLGHGGASGLKDIAGDTIGLDEWFASLQHSAARLPLLVLSVCESAAVARRFAESGVGVAIGFEKKVLPEVCRPLSEAVVHAALSHGGCSGAILRAYDEVIKLHAENAAVSKPRAFYSVL
jgi:hypothetical protein